jgi:predicted dithiol-disulfide oxidoreductase (DUF899 family)
MTKSKIENPKIVSRDQWLIARKELLTKEKELTRLRDQLSAERRKLPMVEVEKMYVFDAFGGKKTLADLFDGRSQLIVYHFMFGPREEEGCPSCSFTADHVDGTRIHFENHGVKFVAISRAPLSEIEAFKKRMGWRFEWVSSYGSEFNYDYHVSFTQEQITKGIAYYNYQVIDPKVEELPGISVFYMDEKGDIFHTYSSYSRGGEILVGAYNYLDLTPKGRNETIMMDWVRHHDKYSNNSKSTDSCCS